MGSTSTVEFPTATTTPKSFKNRPAAVKALAHALGYRGATGGYIYRPLPEFAGYSAGDRVPDVWFGSQVCQGWVAFDKRVTWNAVIEREDGRFTFHTGRLERRLDEAKAQSRKVYAKYIEVLASGDSESAETWNLKVEGHRNRVHALYALLHEGR